MLVRQLDNIRAVATTELANKRHSAVNALEESAWPHGSAYLETAEIIGDVEKSPTKFDLRDIFADVGTIAFDLFSDTHVQTLPRSNTEQGKGAAIGGERKWPQALTLVNAAPFLPTALFFGRMAEQLRVAIGGTICGRAL